MKTLYKLFFVFFFLSTITIHSQSYLGYFFIPTEYGTYTEITGGTVSSAAGNDGAENITLPFPFEYMGITYTTARISVNGWLEMGQTYSGAGSNNELESTLKKPLICPLWDDLYADSQSEIRYETIGEYPARIFIVQWKNIRWFDSPDRKNFQVRLWEIDGTIDFVYGPGTSYEFASYSVGMNNHTGGPGNFISVTIESQYFYNVDTMVANNLNTDVSLLTNGMLLSFVPDIYSFANELAIIYQTPDTVIVGNPNQKIFAIIIPTHAGGVLTPPWVTKFNFNTNGTTNTNDLVNAKLFYTGSSPYFSTNNQLGNTYPNPNGLFEIGGFSQYQINNNLTYFWLAYDISPNATVGNFVDGNCYRIDRETCCPSLIPDTTLATARCVIVGALPVELNSFTADFNNSVVKLEWETASEKNNLGFQIERSKLNSQHLEWLNIGFVSGNGTTTKPHNYTFTDKNLPAGSYKYRLKQIDYDGTFEYSDIVQVEVSPPKEFSLNQNYPNPFNPTTTIKFTISDLRFTILKVYDVLGREVATLVNEEKPPGSYEVEFDGTNLPSGVYFYRIKTGSFVKTRKMILLR